jgi:hypothetical protein
MLPPSLPVESQLRPIQSNLSQVSTRILYKGSSPHSTSDLYVQKRKTASIWQLSIGLAIIPYTKHTKEVSSKIADDGGEQKREVENRRQGRENKRDHILWIVNVAKCPDEFNKGRTHFGMEKTLLESDVVQTVHFAQCQTDEKA